MKHLCVRWRNLVHLRFKLDWVRLDLTFGWKCLRSLSSLSTDLLSDFLDAPNLMKKCSNARPDR